MDSNIKGTGLQEIYDALLRLVNNTPERVPKGTKISRRTVALEAVIEHAQIDLMDLDPKSFEYRMKQRNIKSYEYTLKHLNQAYS